MEKNHKLYFFLIFLEKARFFYYYFLLKASTRSCKNMYWTSDFEIIIAVQIIIAVLCITKIIYLPIPFNIRISFTDGCMLIKIRSQITISHVSDFVRITFRTVCCCVWKDLTISIYPIKTYWTMIHRTLWIPKAFLRVFKSVLLKNP